MRVNDDLESFSLSTEVDVEVAVPAAVDFTGDFAGVEPIEVELGAIVAVECHALGGIPTPSVIATVGPNKDVIDFQEDLVLVELLNSDNNNKISSQRGN